MPLFDRKFDIFQFEPGASLPIRD